MSKSTGPASIHGRCCIILLEKTEGLASVRSRMRTGRKIESTLCVGAGGGGGSGGGGRERENMQEKAGASRPFMCGTSNIRPWL